MAYNDMDVIIYKILSYLYECMKSGVAPREEDLCANAKLFRIPQRYWLQVIEEISDEGLVKGFRFLMIKDGMLVDVSEDARITIKGKQFLTENSRMAAARKFLGAGFNETLSIMIKAIIATV